MMLLDQVEMERERRADNRPNFENLAILRDFVLGDVEDHEFDLEHYYNGETG